MVRDLQMTPSSIEMRVRIKGARAALAGWEPDILGLSIRWLFCQMTGWLDSQRATNGTTEAETVRSVGGDCVWAEVLTIFFPFRCRWSAGGDEAVQ